MASRRIHRRGARLSRRGLHPIWSIRAGPPPAPAPCPRSWPGCSKRSTCGPASGSWRSAPAPGTTQRCCVISSAPRKWSASNSTQALPTPPATRCPGSASIRASTGGDGRVELPGEAPFDRIIATASLIMSRPPGPRSWSRAGLSSLILRGSLSGGLVRLVKTGRGRSGRPFPGPAGRIHAHAGAARQPTPRRRGLGPGWCSTCATRRWVAPRWTRPWSKIRHSGSCCSCILLVTACAGSPLAWRCRRS